MHLWNISPRPLQIFECSVVLMRVQTDCQDFVKKTACNKQCALNNYVHLITRFYSTVVPCKYAPPFATLASVQNGGRAYMRDATISLAITPSLSIKPDSIVICRWGVEAKRKVSPNTRRRDPPNASSRVTSFSVEGRESRALL